MFTCEYCLKEFNIKSNLTRHTKTTRKCIELQQLEFKKQCIKCNVTFVNKLQYETHIESCTISNDELEKILDEKLQLEKELIKIKSRLDVFEQIHEEDKKEKIEIIKTKTNKTTNNINNNINGNVNNNYNLNIFSFEDIKKYANEYTEEHYVQGEIGLAIWTFKNLLQENKDLKFICTDLSRKIFMYKDEEKGVVRDPNANKLKEAIKPALKPIQILIYNNRTGKLYNKIEDLEKLEEEEDIDTSDEQIKVKKQIKDEGKILKENTDINIGKYEKKLSTMTYT